jgi:hypothetical protein
MADGAHPDRGEDAMPFDAPIALVPSRPTPLFAAFARHGLTPVAPALLAAHKLAQQRRFGPSYWYRRRGLLLALLMGPLPLLLIGAEVVEGLGLHVPPPVAWAVAAVMLGMPMLVVTGQVRLRAGAYWQERRLAPSQLKKVGVPEPVAALAREMQGDVPGSVLILGELVRNHVVLDPYLLIARGGEQACLGVWDGEEIIARAA